jgi:hypothetical protein
MPPKNLQQPQLLANFDHPLHYRANHSYDILGAGMLWKPKEARILMNFIDQLVNIR